MVNAISAVGAISPTSAASPAAAPAAHPPLTLDAQLARFQTQLSDSVNCDSAKTPQGQQQIAKISRQIQEIKEQMAQASNTTAPPAAPTGIVDTYA